MDKGLLTQALAKIAKRIGNEEKVLEEGLEGHRLHLRAGRMPGRELFLPDFLRLLRPLRPHPRHPQSPICPLHHPDSHP